jgi:hypothetical protein
MKGERGRHLSEKERKNKLCRNNLKSARETAVCSRGSRFLPCDLFQDLEPNKNLRSIC